MDQHERVVIVTGASSGIGNACATHLAKKGIRVFGTCRNPSAYVKKADEFFEMIGMDITDDDSVSKAVAAVVEKAGRIDAILCNAGMGIAGSIEDSSMEEISLQINTNFLGAVRSVKAVLPVMRAAGSGKILVLSSIAGVVGMPFQAFYSASKYAIEGMVESLRYEVRPFGIQACLIEPGDFRTGFTAARRYVKKADDASPYKKHFEAAMDVQIRDESQGFAPLVVAKRVLQLLESPRLPVRTTVGPGFERFAVIVKRLIPARWFENSTAYTTSFPEPISKVGYFLNWLRICSGFVVSAPPTLRNRAQMPQFRVVFSKVVRLLKKTDDKETPMSIKRLSYGTLDTGEEAALFVLQAGDFTATFSDFGATFLSMLLPDGKGGRIDVLLGTSTLAGLTSPHPHFGATVGRFANRIGGAKFVLSGKRYELAANNGANHLHGGIKGFDKYIWSAETSEIGGAPALRLRRTSPAGEEGYPGRLDIEAFYSLDAGGKLESRFEAMSDAETIHPASA